MKTLALAVVFLANLGTVFLTVFLMVATTFLLTLVFANLIVLFLPRGMGFKLVLLKKVRTVNNFQFKNFKF
ncbi:MAG: hypothetical protein PHQ18_00640 [Patescibacteria group bacterium]|nr:hypothetical protein [Patescibacteria group bacterium]